MIVAHTEIRGEEVPPWCWFVVSSESLSCNQLLRWRFLASYQVALANLPPLLHFWDQSSYKRQTCCWTGLNFCRMKLSQMATDPRKLWKFNPAQVKAYAYLVLLLGWQLPEMAGLLLDRVVLDLLQLAHRLSISTNYVHTIYTAFKLLVEMNQFYTHTHTHTI